MEGPNFDPRVGEQVRVGFRPGIFKVTKVRPAGEEHPNQNLHTTESLLGTVDLRQDGSGFELPAIPWHRLDYVDEARVVRRVIEWLKTSPDGRKYPDYIVDYEVTVEDDHAGNPSIYVRFLVDSDYFFENGKPSEEKVAALNAFLYDVRQTLLGLGLDRWTYVRAGQARKVLDVAS